MHGKNAIFNGRNKIKMSILSIRFHIFNKASPTTEVIKISKLRTDYKPEKIKKVQTYDRG